MTARWTAWRAALRIARRDAWRNKGRSALIALMVALPVLAACTVSVLVRSSDEEPQDRVAIEVGPAAQAVVTSDLTLQRVRQAFDSSSYSSSGDGQDEGGKPKSLSVAEFQRRLQAVLPGDTLHLEALRWSQDVTVGNRIVEAGVAEFDYAAMGSASLYEQVAGRAPRTDDEVVVTRALTRGQQVSLGDRLSLSRRGQAVRVVTVVGVVGGLPATGQARVIARPGAVFTAADFQADATTGLPVHLSWFVSGPQPVTWAAVQEINAFGGAALSRAVVADPPPPSEFDDDFGSTDATVVGTTVVVVGLVLLQIALMAGPAIAVGTRRNERALAIVAATGGQPRNLRAVVLTGSALIGLVSSVVAAGLGVGLGAVLVRVLRAWFEVPLARVDIHPLDLVGLVLVGALTATLAALLPARRVGRLDVTAAIAGRRPLTAPKLRLSVLGILLVAGGLALAWVAAGRASQFPAVLGLGVAEVGLVVASPAVVGLAARAANRTSFVARFAFRDAARQRSRTAPALAAVIAAIAGGMTAVVFAHSSEAVDRATYTSQVPVGSAFVSLGDGDGTSDAAHLEAVRKAVATAFRVAGTAVLGRATHGDLTAWTTCPPRTEDCSETGFGLVIVDPSAAEVLVPDHAEEVSAALRAGKLVAFDDAYVHEGQASLTVTPTGGETDFEKRVPLPGLLVQAKDPLYSALISPAAAARLGVGTEPAMLAITGRDPVTAAQEGRARFAVRALGQGDTFYAERGFEPPSAWVYALLVAIAALVALIGTFTAVGLAAAESRPDLGTLASVGAAPATRRRLGAAQAAAIAVPGALLGLVSGTAGAWALVRLNATANAQWQDPDLWHLRIPWDQAAALGLGIPLLAVVLGFVTVRSRLVLVRRLGE